MKMRITQKWVLATTLVLLSATLLIFPPFRTSAQKTKTDDTLKREEDDSASFRKRSNTLDRNGRTFRMNEVDFEKAMKELDRSMAELSKHDWSKISESMEKAMKAVDMEKIGETIEKAMKAVDMEKIAAEVENSLKEVDMSKVREEVRQAMKEAKRSMEEVKNIDMEEVRQELQKARKEMEAGKVEMKEGLAKARVEMEKAKVQLGHMKEMLTEMKKDGLIKDGEKVNINWKDGKLYINGKEQPQAVTDKYKKYADINIINDRDDDDNDL